MWAFQATFLNAGEAAGISQEEALIPLFLHPSLRTECTTRPDGGMWETLTELTAHAHALHEKNKRQKALGREPGQPRHNFQKWRGRSNPHPTHPAQAQAALAMADTERKPQGWSHPGKGMGRGGGHDRRPPPGPPTGAPNSVPAIRAATDDASKRALKCPAPYQHLTHAQFSYVFNERKCFYCYGPTGKCERDGTGGRGGSCRIRSQYQHPGTPPLMPAEVKATNQGAAQCSPGGGGTGCDTRGTAAAAGWDRGDRTAEAEPSRAGTGKGWTSPLDRAFGRAGDSWEPASFIAEGMLKGVKLVRQYPAGAKVLTATDLAGTEAHGRRALAGTGVVLPHLPDHPTPGMSYRRWLPPPALSAPDLARPPRRA